MKATLKSSPPSRELVGVIKKSGELILRSSVPLSLEKGYPTVRLGLWNSVGNTSGHLEYWEKQEGSTPIYEGDEVTLQF